MLIRDFHENDNSSISAFLESQSDELIANDPFNRQRKQGYGKHSLSELVKGNNGKNKILIAEEKNKIIGYASGWVKVIEEFPAQTGAPATNGMLDNLYVLPSSRGKGVAKALVAAMEHYFKENKCSLIWLNVYANNSSAVGLYKGQGYSTNSLTMIKVMS